MRAHEAELEVKVSMLRRRSWQCGKWLPCLACQKQDALAGMCLLAMHSSACHIIAHQSCDVYLHSDHVR